MYAKIFQSIFDGSIARNWQTRVVFMDLLILADKEGVVDMTHDAIAARTRVPLEVVKTAISELEQPDADSRRPDLDGKRIERIDSHKNWGWRIVNFKYYHALCSLEQKREADRLRLRTKREEEKREKSNTVATCRNPSHEVANVAYTDTDTYTDNTNNICPKLPRNHEELFDKTWQIYPRKVEKQRAFKAWKVRIKSGISPKSLHKAVEHYADAMQDKEPQYIKHGATFFGPSQVWKDWEHGNPLAKEQEGWV